MLTMEILSAIPVMLCVGIAKAFIVNEIRRAKEQRLEHEQGGNDVR